MKPFNGCKCTSVSLDESSRNKFGSRHKGQLLIHDCRKLDSHGNEISPCLIALALTHLYTVVNLLSPPLLSTQTRCSCPQHEPSLSLTFAPCLDTIKPQPIGKFATIRDISRTIAFLKFPDKTIRFSLSEHFTTSVLHRFKCILNTLMCKVLRRVAG